MLSGPRQPASHKITLEFQTLQGWHGSEEGVRRHRLLKESEHMSYKIVASQCTVCGACEFECPNAAISLKRDMYVIDPKKCTECEGS